MFFFKFVCCLLAKSTVNFRLLSAQLGTTYELRVGTKIRACQREITTFESRPLYFACEQGSLRPLLLLMQVSLKISFFCVISYAKVFYYALRCLENVYAI